MSDKTSPQPESFSKTICRFAGFISSLCQVTVIVSMFAFVHFGIFDHGNKPVGPTVLIGFLGIGSLVSAIVCLIAGIISTVGATTDKSIEDTKHDA